MATSVVGFSTVSVVRGRGMSYGEGERYLCDDVSCSSYDAFWGSAPRAEG